MKKLFILLTINLLLNSRSIAHPGTGIVKNSKGEIFYSDLARVWKVSPDGKTKTVVVPNVHTHELHVDMYDNLYGEHLWYEGEVSDKWKHFVWKYDAKGKFTKEIPDADGFLSNYSFNRDSAGNMYWIERGKTESLFMKKAKNGVVEVVQTIKTTDVRWQFCRKDGTFYFINDNDLYQIKDRKVRLLAQNLDDVEGSSQFQKPNHSIFGIWADNAGNIYATIYEKREVRKVSADGKVIIIYKSSPLWHPTGGLLDEKGNLWVLENNATNQVRVSMIEKQVLAKNTSSASYDNQMIINVLLSIVMVGLVTVLIKLISLQQSLKSIVLSSLFIIGLSLSSVAQQSGIAVGTDAPAFDPIHVSGADKNTKTCPMCKYGAKTEGLMIWLNDDVSNYENLLTYLEAQYLTKEAKKWKVFVMYMNPKKENIESLKVKLTAFSDKLRLKNVAFTFISSPTDEETAGVYAINPKVSNTIFAYKKRVIVKKFINFDPKKENYSSLLNF